MIKDYKAVLSMRVARALIADGYELVDIQPSIKQKGKLVFIFKNTPELDAEFKKFERKD
ncbi:hypothetical protein HRF69_03220 [Bacillus circulans]|uniref:DUF5659 domain-containing protein n=1 Tax=Niallia circulans TaxID=1397 RepID=UPI0015610F8A|nr:DUF5659 domain-containing protein [Niallia circulans]NRG26126.1 hypothetical protein [Niallia circulans]